jgi:hypothetical protein
MMLEVAPVLLPRELGGITLPSVKIHTCDCDGAGWDHGIVSLGVKK